MQRIALLKFSCEDKNDYSSLLLSNQVRVILPLLVVDTLACYITASEDTLPSTEKACNALERTIQKVTMSIVAINDSIHDGH